MIELSTYIRAFRRSLWLIIVTALIFGIGGYLVIKLKPVQYRAVALVQVGSTQASQSPDTDQLLASEKVAETLAIMAKRTEILQATVDNLHLDMKPAALNRYLEVNVSPGTALLQIAISYSEPVLASQMANEVAAQLVAKSATTGTNGSGAESFLATEIASTKTELAGSQTALAAVEDQIANSGSSIPPEILSQRSAIIANINSEKVALVQLVSTLNDLQKSGRSNALAVVDSARVPDQPNGPAATSLALLLSVAGGVIASSLVFGREFLRDNIKNPSELSVQLGINIIGAVSPFGRRAIYRDKLNEWRKRNSTVAQDYRAMRTNLLSMAHYLELRSAFLDYRPRIYIVSSPNAKEGKSVTAANLAVAFAEANMRVLLIDTNFRHPVQHRIFNLDNKTGLSNALAPEIGASESDQKQLTVATDNNPVSASIVLDKIRKTKIPKLSILTAGSKLSSIGLATYGAAQMQDFVTAASADYEVIIFDAPSLLNTSELAILASVVGSTVLMVIDPERTLRGSVIRGLHQVGVLSIPLGGIVLNRWHWRDLDTGYGAFVFHSNKPPTAEKDSSMLLEPGE